MDLKNYDVCSDKMFVKATTINKLAKHSVKTYANATKQFCIANDDMFENIVKEMKDNEFGEIIDGTKIKPYDVEESITKQKLLIFKQYLLDKKSSSNTINNRMSHIRTLLGNCNVILPKPFKKEKDDKKLTLLRRKDISYIIEISNVHHKAILSFAGCTGLRVNDLVKLTIADFMYATRNYHNASSVEEFIETAPSGMVGYWELIPHKTKSHNLECCVCNTPESSDFILESLRHRMESIKKMNKKYGKDEKLELDDALFSSTQKYYKGFMNEHTFGVVLYGKNKKLQVKLKKELEEQLKRKEISLIEYQKKLEELPKIHPHALRHYFISVLNAYCSNKTIALKMEAHRSNVPTHKHYIGTSDELYGEDMIREHYEKLIPYLTFNYNVDYSEYSKMKQLVREFGDILSIDNPLEYM